MISDIENNFVKSEGSKRNEFFINPSVEELKEFSASRVMKDFQKNLGPEDQQPILTESERFAAIKKEKDEFDNRKKIEIKGLPPDMKAEVRTFCYSPFDFYDNGISHHYNADKLLRNFCSWFSLQLLS